MKRAGLIVCFLVLVVANTLSQQKDASTLSGPYLGQKPPGLRPEVFASGIVSTSEHEFSCCFSTECKYLFFGSDGGIPGRKADIYWVSAKLIEDLKLREMK